MTDKKDTFLKGAFILTVAGLVVKILGAVYRIPLARMIEDEGMGLYQMAYPIYVTLLAISTAGLPTAISKLVAEDLAVGRYRNAHRIFKVSLAVLAIVGFVLTFALIVEADFLAENVLGNPKAYYPLVSIAPAIFFVSIMSSFRGFFQGLQDMTPSAISQIVEQIGRVAAVFILATLLLPRGIEYAAAGAAFGPVAGAVVGLLVLLVVYFKRRKELYELLQLDSKKQLENPASIIYRLFAFAIPITLGGLIMPIMNLADVAIVSRRLQDAGFSVKRATELYGQLTGMAAPLINLPTIITISLSASLVPAISEALALKDVKLAASRAETGVRISFIFGLPAAIGMFVLATPITTLLYNNSEAGASLAVLSWGIIFLLLNQTTTGVLQGVGKAFIPVRNLLLGVALKIILNYTLTSIPHINVKGAALGSVAAYLFSAVLNFASVIKYTGLKIDMKKTIAKPVIASLGMGAAVYIAFEKVVAAGVSQNKATLAGIIVGGIVYVILLFLLGGVQRQDLEVLPGGQRIVGLLDKFAIFRR